MQLALKWKPVLFASVLVVISAQNMALTKMQDSELSDVQGTGLAFAMDDFSIRFAPTSFIEAIGSEPSPQAATCDSPDDPCWKRGDARYYGLSLTSGSNAGTDWYGNGCGDGSNPLSCPIGTGDGDFGTTAFASIYDPFVLRVFQYKGFDYQGDWLDGSAGNEMPTILEFIGPKNTDPWRWSFWGELEVDRTNNNANLGVCNNSSSGCSGGADFLQSQTIIHGKPVAKGHIWQGLNDSGNDQGYEENPDGNRQAILRLMQTANTDDQTLGITYDSALSGDFRFSVRQNDNPTDPNEEDALHWVPDFDDEEGLHFKNVDAFLPLGTLHYQAITFSGVSMFNADASRRTEAEGPIQNGNFSIELTRIPNNPNIYSHFYAGVTDGSCDQNDGNGNCTFSPDGSIATPNPDTHGYVRWGNWCTDASCTATIDPYNDTPQNTGAYALPSGISTDNGIYFRGSPNPDVPTSNTVNLGISRIEGMAIQHMKITTLGAGT